MSLVQLAVLFCSFLLLLPFLLLLLSKGDICTTNKRDNVTAHLRRRGRPSADGPHENEPENGPRAKYVQGCFGSEQEEEEEEEKCS